MMKLFLIGLALFYIVSQIAALLLLILARKKSLKANANRTRPSSYPGVSIITSLKGPTPGVHESIKSLLCQNYSGPREYVFATLDANEPLIPVVKKIIEEFPGDYTVKWVFPVDVQSKNPRTAKIAKAFEASSHPWVFMICVDTRFSIDYLQRAVELTQLDEKIYVTSFPVIDDPKSFVAKIEAVGLNVDVSQFFLLSSLSAKSACAYGGAFLYSRSLAQKAGGYDPLLRLLTDDITLAKALSAVGGLCYLADDVAYVHQPQLSLKSFWSRQRRWRMIGRYFLPHLFWVGPLSWVQLYLVLGGFFLREPILFALLLLLTGSRITIGVGIQKLLSTPKGDWWHAWVLPIYDWIAILAWLFSAVQNTISWGPNLLKINSRGEVTDLKPQKK